jgi:hypothetical protein
MIPTTFRPVDYDFQHFPAGEKWVAWDSSEPPVFSGFIHACMTEHPFPVVFFHGRIGKQ